MEGQTGALGVIAPHVRTAAEARDVVRAARLPPLGERSNTGIFPHLQYRAFPAEETAKAINSATMVIVHRIGRLARQGRRDHRG